MRYQAAFSLAFIGLAASAAINTNAHKEARQLDGLLGPVSSLTSLTNNLGVNKPPGNQQNQKPEDAAAELERQMAEEVNADNAGEGEETGQAEQNGQIPPIQDSEPPATQGEQQGQAGQAEQEQPAPAPQEEPKKGGLGGLTGGLGGLGGIL